MILVVCYNTVTYGIIRASLSRAESSLVREIIWIRDSRLGHGGMPYRKKRNAVEGERRLGEDGISKPTRRSMLRSTAAPSALLPNLGTILDILCYSLRYYMQVRVSSILLEVVMNPGSYEGLRRSPTNIFFPLVITGARGM